MAILDISKIRSAKELEKRVRKDLEGKTLAQIAVWIKNSDTASRVSTKAGVGHLIEEGYFGIGKNNTNGPDIPHLKVEIKTSPLKIGSDGRLRVKEPLSLNIINYKNEHSAGSIKKSSLYKKNKNILFVWYIHHKDHPRSKYRIKYVFLWTMDTKVLSELEPDYKKILEKIAKGKAHQIHQSDHVNLTLCPKHGGKFKDPKCKKSKTSQPIGKKPAEVRAFRLKSSYTNHIIRRYLAKERPTELMNFVTERKSKKAKVVPKRTRTK